MVYVCIHELEYVMILD